MTGKELFTKLIHRKKERYGVPLLEKAIPDLIKMAKLVDWASCKGGLQTEYPMTIEELKRKRLHGKTKSV